MQFICAARNEVRILSQSMSVILGLFSFLGCGEISKEAVLAWKDALTKGYAPASVNSMLAAVNSFFEWMNLTQFKRNDYSDLHDGIRHGAYKTA